MRRVASDLSSPSIALPFSGRDAETDARCHPRSCAALEPVPECMQLIAPHRASHTDLRGAASRCAPSRGLVQCEPGCGGTTEIGSKTESGPIDDVTHQKFSLTPNQMWSRTPQSGGVSGAKSLVVREPGRGAA